MKNLNKKLTLLTILALGASIAQPSGIFNTAKSKFSTLIQRLPLVNAYQDRLATKAYLGAEKQTEISVMFATLLQDVKNPNLVISEMKSPNLEERISNLAYDHTKTVEAFRKKAESDNHSNKARSYFDIIVASATGIALGFGGSKLTTTDDQPQVQTIQYEALRAQEESRKKMIAKQKAHAQIAHASKIFATCSKTTHSIQHTGFIVE